MDIDKETIKAFCGIDKAIDGSFLKLSDKLSDLTLSHNRKKKALEEIEDLIQQPEFKMKTYDITHDCPKVLYFFPVDKIDLILKKIDNALWSDGRERMKPFKTKGGK